MSLEFVRELIKVNQVIAEDTTQAVIENDIIVPDVKPDINRILLIDGDAIVTETEALQDKILVNGTIRFKILYASDDPEIGLKAINYNYNFSHGLDANKLRQGMKCKAKCDIEHIDYEILNGRKINVKTIMKISGKAIDEFEREIVTDLKGIEYLQVLKNNANINMYIGSNKELYKINESLEVPAGKPAIREILRSDIKITGKDFKITDNKIIAKGELGISTLYIGDDGSQSIQTMEHEIPFTQFVDLPGVSEESSCDVDYQVADVRLEVAEDSDGELRTVEGDFSLDILVEGYNKINLDLLDDAYSPKARLSIEKESFKIEEPICENKSQIILKDTLIVHGENRDIIEVFNVLSKPVLTDCKVQDDKVTVEGIVKNNVLYLSNNDEEPVCCAEQESAFKQVIDLRGIKKEMGCEVELQPEHCNYSMISSTEVEIRIVISVTTKVKNQIVCPIISKVAELPIDEKKMEEQPSIIIYFSQPGDTLWKVAKKYYTTIDDIQRVNNMSERDLISSGQQIIIPKRVL